MASGDIPRCTSVFCCKLRLGCIRNSRTLNTFLIWGNCMRDRVPVLDASCPWPLHLWSHPAWSLVGRSNVRCIMTARASPVYIFEQISKKPWAALLMTRLLYRWNENGCWFESKKANGIGLRRYYALKSRVSICIQPFNNNFMVASYVLFTPNTSSLQLFIWRLIPWHIMSS